MFPPPGPLDYPTSGQLPIAFLWYRGLVISGVEDRWKKISLYLEQLLFSEDSACLQGDSYVAAHFFDDQKYTQTKKCMWIVACIAEFDNALYTSIRQREKIQ
jgi:hypothetical protein